MPLNVSPTKVITKIPSLSKRGRDITLAFRKQMNAAHKEASNSAQDILRRAIKLSGAVATGKLMDSVTAKMVGASSSDMYTSEVGFKKPASQYAYFANYGRDSGGIPPLKAILKWMQAKGIDSKFLYAIAISIGQYGTDGHHFMELAAPEIRKGTKVILDKRIREFKRSL